MTTNKYKFEMLGGEFCGNACRSVAYYCFEKFGKSEIEIEINNIKLLSNCNNNYAEVKVDYNVLIEKVSQLEDNIFLVKMNSISQIVVLENSSLFNKKASIEMAQQVIDKFKIDDFCVGVMYFSKNKMQPLVYIKKVNTFFNETACASGSIACAIVQDLIKKENYYKIIQPTNEIIEVHIGEKILVNGKIKRIRDGKITF